ncbi:MAG: MmcB family DNA repair protein [Alphaproteobacteria bacterium]
MEPSRPELTFAVTQGILRLCADKNWAPLTEVSLKNGRRADVLALDKDGTFHCIEVKSSREDFQGDQKWRDYLDFCDTFSFAVPADFPIELIPSEVGVIVCDPFGWHEFRGPYRSKLHPSRRKAMMIRFARLAALRSGALS